MSQLENWKSSSLVPFLVSSASVARSVSLIFPACLSSNDLPVEEPSLHRSVSSWQVAVGSFRSFHEAARGGQGSDTWQVGPLDFGVGCCVHIVSTTDPCSYGFSSSHIYL